LPQIAAAGRTHFHIEKRVRGGRTVTSVVRLDHAGRVSEVARMLGGGLAGESARSTARELLDRMAGDVQEARKKGRQIR
jgi:DNA repair protein RecN (Recombination protein N)